MNEQQLPPLPEPNHPAVFGYTSADMKAYARAALAAQGVPADWRMVPPEATPEMMRAAVVYANGNAVYKNVAAEALAIEESIYGEVWAAMLAATPAPAQAQQAEGYVSQSALDWLADHMRGQRSCITTTIYRQPEGGSNTPIYIHAATKVEAEQNPDTADAERYRWLVSRPLDGDDEFYINAEDSKTANADGFWALGGDMSKTQADDYIDAARGVGASSGESGK